MSDQEDPNLKEIEAQKVQLLASQHTISNLQLRLDNRNEQKDKLGTKLSQLEVNSKKAKEDYEDVIDLLKQEVWKLTQKKLNLESELTQKAADLIATQETAKKKIEKLTNDFDTEKNTMNERYRSLEEKYNLICHFEEEKEDMLKKIDRLETELEATKADRLRMMADMEREKVEKIEKLKQEMAVKIQETRNQLLAFKTDQLDTASKLAVVQNHQLTTELEYQGRQVERMVEKFSRLEEDNARLKREVQIHKEVENEMAKKNQRAQGVIRKLNERIQGLENPTDEPERTGTSEFNSTGLRRLMEEKGVSDKKKDDVIRILEKNLESAEAKLAKLQNDYGLLARDFDNIERKLTQERSRYSDAATLVSEALDGMFDRERRSTKSQKGSDSAICMALDLDEIKETSIKNLDKSQKQILLEIILEQIKSHLNEKNLVNAFYPVIKGRSNSYGVLVVDKKAYQLPNIHERSLSRNINKSKFDYSSPGSVKSSINRSSIKDWEISSTNASPSPASSIREKVKYRF